VEEARRALASLRWRAACCIGSFVAILLFEQGACGCHGLFASFAPYVAAVICAPGAIVLPRGAAPRVLESCWNRWGGGHCW